MSMEPDSGEVLEARARETAQAVRRILGGLPAEIWTTTTPPTFFRIADNRAEIVPADYQPQPGDLVFLYRNDGGYISIIKAYPPEEASPGGGTPNEPEAAQ